MEQKLQLSSSVVCDRLLPLVAKYPWLQAAHSKEDGDQVPYNMNDSLLHYPCRMPVLMGRRIRGCFYGWVILSSHPDNVKWLLWNPVTSKTIHLPPLFLDDGDYESLRYCLLSSPPDDSGSLLLFNRVGQRTFVFCRLDRNRKRLRWTEMTYAKQLNNITGLDNGFLEPLTCCNGKVYALVSVCSPGVVIHVDIEVKHEEVVITLLSFVKTPEVSCNVYFRTEPFLKGSTELYYVEVGCTKTMRSFTDVCLFKLEMTSMIWEKLEDLDNAIFFVDYAHRWWLFHRHTGSSELGGYVHIFGKDDKVISSYNVKDNTVSLSSMSSLLSASYVPLWESRADAEGREDEFMDLDGEVVDININSTRSSPLFDISFDALKMIMELCVGVEYLNFRATCKQCQLAAPLTRRFKELSLRRLQTYSLASPWLMMIDKYQGIITFIDPMFGNRYFMKTPPELIGDVQIRCSRYGWVLFYNLSHISTVMLFNPFTKDIHKPSLMNILEIICFVEPPTSLDFYVFGLMPEDRMFSDMRKIDTETWQKVVGYIDGNFGENVPSSVSFPTICDGKDVYALEDGGRLDVYRLKEDGRRFWEVVAEAPRDCLSATQCFLVNCDEHHLLLVRVEEYGESVEVFKLSQTTQKWEKIDGLGRRMIYICDASCFCIEAKTPEMENKIYFPRLHSKNGKVVFYSLDTCRYHTFNGRNVEKESFGDFLGTKYILNPHAWIEPSWC